MMQREAMLEIAVTQGDIQAVVASDPIVALKIENVALRRLLLEARAELTRLKVECSPNGTPADVGQQ